MGGRNREKADITIAFPGPAGVGSANVGNAQQGTKYTGTVIYLAGEPRPERKIENPPHWWYTEQELDECECEEIIRRRQHHKVITPQDAWILDGASTGAARRFNRRNQEQVKISSQSFSEIQNELNKAIANAIQKHGTSVRIVVLPDANTLPLNHFHEASTSMRG